MIILDLYKTLKKLFVQFFYLSAPKDVGTQKN